MLSCKLGLISIAENLLLQNANLYEVNILGDTALKLAQRNGHEELALILMQKYNALNRNRPGSKK
jgi:ankyrin repeat protein